MKNIFYYLIIGVTILLINPFFRFDKVFAQTASDSSNLTASSSSVVSNDRVKELEKQIENLQNKISITQNKENSLSSQIEAMDNQIQLTQYRINVVQEQINDTTLDIDTAGKRIKNLEGSLNNVTKVLLNRIVATYQAGEVEPVRILLASSNLQEFLSRENYLKIVQEHDKELLYNSQQAKVDYANQKSLLETKKKKIVALQSQLEAYTKELDQEKESKETLLAVTKNDEKKYQDLLAEARSEYEAIQGIVAGKGNEVNIGHVDEGQKIASIIQGSSCNSGGSHLHFIVSQNGNTVNPFNYLKKGIDFENCSGSSCGSSDGDNFNPSGNWNWPIGPKIELSQGYGVTWAINNTYLKQIYNFHNGIDINSSSSYDVKAVSSGTLLKGSYSGLNGCRLRYVRVKHDDGLETLYLHINYVL